jgi:hypothetical protein
MIAVLKARPRLQTQWAQIAAQHINFLRGGADFTIPGKMSIKDGATEEGYSQIEADYIFDNYPPFAHYSAPGKTWDAQSAAIDAYSDAVTIIKTVLSSMWDEYLGIPSWETYKNNWSALSYDVAWGHFYMMSRETADDNIAIGIKWGSLSGLGFRSVSVYDYWSA